MSCVFMLLVFCLQYTEKVGTCSGVPIQSSSSEEEEETPPQTQEYLVVTDQTQDNLDPSQAGTSSDIPEMIVRPKGKGKGKTTAKTTAAAHETVLGQLQRQQQENQGIQGQISSFLGGPRPTPVALWGQWLGTVAEQIDQRFIHAFYQRTLDVVTDLVDASRNLPRPLVLTAPTTTCIQTTMLAHQPPSYVTAYPQQQQQQFPASLQGAAGTSSGPWVPAAGSSGRKIFFDTPAPTSGQATVSPVDPTAVRPHSTPNVTTLHGLSQLSDMSFGALMTPQPFNTTQDTDRPSSVPTTDSETLVATTYLASKDMQRN